MPSLTKTVRRMMTAMLGLWAVACTHTQVPERTSADGLTRSASSDRQLGRASMQNYAREKMAVNLSGSLLEVKAAPRVVSIPDQGAEMGAEDGLLVFTVAGDDGRSGKKSGEELVWEDLIHSNEMKFEPNPLLGADSLALTHEQLASLPKSLHGNRALAMLALSRAVVSPQAFHGGVLGNYGSGRLFATTTNFVQDYNRLYWIMVQLLSEKYGCFMVSKIEYGEATEVRCRDERRVVFWKSRGRGWIQFVSRQFDREGYEIQVQKRRIVRISKERMI